MLREEKNDNYKMIWVIDLTVGFLLFSDHKNVKAFISHGGMLSTTEAAHCGVPMVAIPLFGDQFANSAAAKDSGLGTVLHYKDITKESLLEALNTVLDPK